MSETAATVFWLLWPVAVAAIGYTQRRLRNATEALEFASRTIQELQRENASIKQTAGALVGQGQQMLIEVAKQRDEAVRARNEYIAKCVCGDYKAEVARYSGNRGLVRSLPIRINREALTNDAVLRVN